MGFFDNLNAMKLVFRLVEANEEQVKLARKHYDLMACIWEDSLQERRLMKESQLRQEKLTKEYIFNFLDELANQNDPKEVHAMIHDFQEKHK